MSKSRPYKEVSEKIIDQWLDEGYKLSELIELYITQTQITATERIAQYIETTDKNLARQVRSFKPRLMTIKPFEVKNSSKPL